MRVSNLMLLVSVLLLASCSKVIKTAQHTDVNAQVSSFPTVGDLHISSQRVSKSVSWKWNPFNTTSLAARKENVKADLIKEAGADLLVEPEFVQRTSFGNILGGSLTVSGYPATIDNFRTATQEDIVALRVAGALKGNCNDENIYIVIDPGDIDGVVIGMPAKVSSDVTPAEQVTNSVETIEEVPSVTNTENVIPGDPIAVAPANTGNKTGVHTKRTAEDNTYVNRLTGGSPNGNSLTGAHATLNRSTGSSSRATGQVNTATANTSISEPIAYDRIGKDRFLITMSREYYGNPNFWPYIYEENRVKFGHPDKIRPGSGVVIPNLKKYGVDPNNPADVEKAKKLAKEIYARYGVNI